MFVIRKVLPDSSTRPNESTTVYSLLHLCALFFQKRFYIYSKWHCALDKSFSRNKTFTFQPISGAGFSYPKQPILTVFIFHLVKHPAVRNFKSQYWYITIIIINISLEYMHATAFASSQKEGFTCLNKSLLFSSIVFLLFTRVTITPLQSSFAC